MRIVSLALILALSIPLSSRAQDAPKNVILFISDGCGPASFTLAREFLRFKDGGALALDAHQVGSMSTWAYDSRVTDSAASGTAMACGVKTKNGAIAVDTAGLPIATILEAAEARDMATGLVVTSTISHATPAVFSAHVPNRADQSEIAIQQLEQGIEVLFGGGEAFYLPEQVGGRRSDNLNLFEIADAKGYRIARNRDEFMHIESVPALAIFTPDQMTFEIDRDTTLEPSLEEMTRKAIELLDDDPDGFFLMVEGSRIDHAGHGNDVATHLQEILQFDAAFGVAVEFAENHGQTLVVSTSDHETGGMSLGRNVDGRAVYSWQPDVIDRVPASVFGIIEMAEEREVEICSLLEDEIGLTCSDADRAAIESADPETMREAYITIGKMISKAAGIGWTSTGHTAVDVNLYAFGPGSQAFVGHHDNTQVAVKIAELMSFDLEALTERLRMSSD